MRLHGLILNQETLKSCSNSVKSGANDSVDSGPGAICLVSQAVRCERGGVRHAVMPYGGVVLDLSELFNCLMIQLRNDPEELLSSIPSSSRFSIRGLGSWQRDHLTRIHRSANAFTHTSCLPCSFGTRHGTHKEALKLRRPAKQHIKQRIIKS